MKPIIYLIAVVAALFVYSADALAQCDRSVNRPIRCGYYEEGYEDGMNDARTNRPSDYRRYRSKFENQYESFYRNGYDAGFSAAGPSYPSYPGGGGGIGSATWSGRVDNIVQLTLQGNSLRAQDMTNSGMQTTYQNVNGSLPRRSVIVNANKFGGRGDVRVVQQPNRSNGFTAIVEISDPRGGADNYRVDINWQAGGPVRDEPYQTGRVNWRGRVDNTVNIFVAGSSVRSEIVSGSPLVGDSFTINGYLAARPGSVRVRKLNGRGNVTIIQQPSLENDFTAIIQVVDEGGGPDNYQLEILW
jgi:hypothetical protein